MRNKIFRQWLFSNVLFETQQELAAPRYHAFQNEIWYWNASVKMDQNGRACVV